MAYYVVSERLLDSFPENCPYCTTANATASFVQPFGKMTSAHTSKTLSVKLPACEKCALWFKGSRLLMFILGFSVPVALLGVVMMALSYSPNHMPNVLEMFVPTIWLLLMAAWILSIIWRRWRFRHLRVAYFNDGEVAYAGQAAAYMNQFAALNGLRAEERPFLVRVR